MLITDERYQLFEQAIDATVDAFGIYPEFVRITGFHSYESVIKNSNWHLDFLGTHVTPVKMTIFVLSKVIPYWIIGVIDITLAIIIAVAIYGLAPAGSLGAIYLATILFLFVMSGLGIVIANRSNSMSQSMFLMFFVVVIFVLMSGLLTPISSMPDWAQAITYALPPRYYIDIMCSVYLKATPMPALQLQFIVFSGFAILTNSLAAITYNKQN